MRCAAADAQREVRSVSRVPEPGDTASVHEASALDIVVDIRSGATVPAMDAPVSHSAVSPRQPPPGVKLGLLCRADCQSRSAASESAFPAVYRRLRDILDRYDHSSRTDIANDVRRVIDRIRRKAVYELERCGWAVEDPGLGAPDMSIAEEAYRILREMARDANHDCNVVWAGHIHETLKYIDHATSREWDRLTMTYGALDALSTRTMQLPRATGAPPVAVPSTTMPLIERLPVSGPAHPIVPQVDPAFPEPAGGLVHATDVPGPPPASSLPGPSLSEGTGAEAGGLGRGWLEPPTTTGATPAHPAASETTVTPSLAGTSSFWLQPFEPVPAPGTVPFGSGPLRIRGTTRRAPGYRAAIADQLRNDDALLEAEYALRTGGADAIGWTPTQWQAVLADLYRINTIAEVGAAADAARLDLDWSGFEALARILDCPPPSP